MEVKTLKPGDTFGNTTITSNWFKDNSGILTLKEPLLYYDANEDALIKSITIPTSTASIEDGAFMNNGKITSIIIPDYIDSIGDEAFRSCYNMTSTIIGNSVSTIGRDAFLACLALKTVYIPESVTSLGSFVFASCNVLHTITYNSTLSNWITLQADKNLFQNIERPIIVNCIDNNICYLNGDDNKYYINTNDSWFIYSSGTTKNNSNTIISNTTGVSSGETLTSVMLSNKATEINPEAFSSDNRIVSNLTKFVIMSSLTKIGSYAFYGCTSLYTITYAGTKEQWNNINIDTNAFSGSSISTINCIDGDITI